MHFTKYVYTSLGCRPSKKCAHINNRIQFGAQDKRISVIDALAHPYLDEGRLRYHSCMCKCCFTTAGGMRQYTADFEPATSQPFDDLWERKFTSVHQVKGMIYIHRGALASVIKNTFFN